jgi:hypothetical protein
MDAEIIKELEELDMKIADLKRNLNNQVNAIESDISDFHKQLIDLSAKYPQHKQLLEFVVFVNDKLETDHSNFKAVLMESMNELIQIKRDVLKQNIKAKKSCMDKFTDMAAEAQQEALSFWQSLIGKINSFKDLKWLLTVCLIIIIIVGFIVIPETMIQALSWIIKIAI